MLKQLAADLAYCASGMLDPLFGPIIQAAADYNEGITRIVMLTGWSSEEAASRFRRFHQRFWTVSIMDSMHLYIELLLEAGPDGIESC